MGTFTPAARVLSWSSGQLRTPENPDNPERKLSIHAVSLAANILSCTFSIQWPNVELSWFFWIVVFLSVWVIYTTSA